MDNSNGKNGMGKAVIKEFEIRLNNMLRKLRGDRRAHDEEMKESVSARPADEFSLKDDIETIEQQDSMEGLEINLVENAIQRIGSGDYGYCLKCRGRIPLERLKAIPYAEYCVSCKEQLEKSS